MAKLVPDWTPTQEGYGAIHELYEHEGRHFLVSHSMFAGEVAIFEAAEVGNIASMRALAEYKSECLPFPFQLARTIEGLVA